MSYSFDELSTDAAKKNEKPLWALGNLDAEENQGAILKWLTSELAFLQKENEDRLKTIKHNIARYKGIQYQAQETRAGNRDRDNEKAKFSPKLVVNLLAIATEQRVSRLIKFRPGVSILPTNNEHQDKISARSAKQVADHIQYLGRYEEKNRNAVRLMQICGEGYLDFPWNPDLGAVHPDNDPEAELLDEDGKPVVGKDGKPRKIGADIKIGDVDIKLLNNLCLFLEKKDSYDDSLYSFYIERVNTEELKQEYEQHASKITADSEKNFYSISKLEEEKLQNETLKITFQHKDHKRMPKGRWIVFTKDVILENGPHKYDHGDFSFERLAGNEIPGEQHAYSFFEQCKGINAQFNNVTNMIVRNQALVAHPKWFVPRGSVKLEALGNDITIAQYQGAQAPILAQQNPTPAEVFNFRKELKEDFLQQAQLGDVMRGEPPPGIKAGVALQFLAEQEAQIANDEVAKYNDFQVRCVKKILKVAAQHYDPSDKRTIMVMGQNKHWTSINFDPKHLATSFDIRIQNSSALPDSKAARTQYILDMAERFPTLLPQEQVAEMLEFGQTEKFMDTATAAVRAAEHENERILNGEQVEAPEQWEDSLVHWQTHIKVMQDSSFKSKDTPEEIRQAMKDHVMATEMLLLKAAETNMALGQALSTLVNFPLFFTAPPPPAPVDPMAAGGEPMQPEGAPMGAIEGDMMPADQLPQPEPTDVLDQMPPEEGVPV